MAIRKDAEYTGRWEAATAEYPMGKPKNRTTSTSKDGSYLEKKWIQDYEAFFGAMMNGAGITPNDAEDTALASQFFDAMETVVCNKIFPVGSVTLRMDAINPASIYGGSWSLIYTADSDIKLGDGSNQNGVASGNNSPAVPLKNHNHTATFSGNALPTHTHGLPSNSNDQTADGYVADSDGGGTPRTANTGATSAGTPSGSVTVNTTGDGATPTLDVRGKGVAINVWQRTA